MSTRITMVAPVRVLLASLVALALPGCVERPTDEQDGSGTNSATDTNEGPTDGSSVTATGADSGSTSADSDDSDDSDDSNDDTICFGFCDFPPFPDLPRCTPPDDHVWIGQPLEGTVAKVATATQTVEGRYEVGPPGSSAVATAVGLDGDVAVATGTAVAQVRGECGPGSTSAGWDDVLPFGDDDCLAWHTPLLGTVTTVAWSPGSWDPIECLYEDARIWATVYYGPDQPVEVLILDGQTGVVTESWLVTGVPFGTTSPRDAMLDADENLWFIQDDQLVVADVFGGLPIATLTEQATALTIDPEGFAWISGGETLWRVDTSTRVLLEVTLGTSGPTGGLAADDGELMWLTQGASVLGINRFTLVLEVTLELIEDVHGLGVDAQGDLWTVSPQDTLTVIDPATGESSALLLPAEHAGRSDITGGALRVLHGR